MSSFKHGDIVECLTDKYEKYCDKIKKGSIFHVYSIQDDFIIVQPINDRVYFNDYKIIVGHPEHNFEVIDERVIE